MQKYGRATGARLARYWRKMAAFLNRFYFNTEILALPGMAGSSTGTFEDSP